MKAISTALLALLKSKEFMMFEAFKIELTNGSTLALTDASFQFAMEGDQYEPAIISRNSLKQSLGLSTDSMDLELVGGDSSLVGGVAWKKAARNGAFDRAKVKCKRCYFAATSFTPTGSIWKFSGKVGRININGDTIKLQVNSPTELLNAKVPPGVYQPECLNTLFDNQCSLNRASYLLTASTQAGTTKSSLVITNNASAGYYSGGEVEVMAGANSGAKRTIKTHNGSSFEMALPFSEAMGSGVSVKITPGCNRTMETCKNKFSNVIHFRGTPFVPTPETAI